MAPRPKFWTKKDDWSRWRNGTENENESVSGWGEAEGGDGDENGELVLEEVKGWGEGNGWGEDKYKPPHIKALEEQAQTEVMEW